MAGLYVIPNVVNAFNCGWTGLRSDEEKDDQCVILGYLYLRVSLFSVLFSPVFFYVQFDSQIVLLFYPISFSVLVSLCVLFICPWAGLSGFLFSVLS